MNIKKIKTKLYLITTIILIITLFTIPVSAKEYVVVDDFVLSEEDMAKEEQEDMSFKDTIEQIQKEIEDIYSSQSVSDNNYISNDDINVLINDYKNLVIEVENSNADIYVYGRSFNTITLEDFDLLCRLTQAEAGNQCLEGKMAVAEVVLNRVEKKCFPNTIYDVIYAYKQFQPTRNGAINKKASLETKACVLMALQYQHLDKNVCYFKAGGFFSGLKQYKQIGAHYFSYCLKQ